MSVLRSFLALAVLGSAIGALALSPSFAGAAEADESSLQLKEGPDRQLVQTLCSQCHSVDYILTNTPILDRKGWEAAVNKMINLLGAPIKAEDVPKIVGYLAHNYGK